MGAQTASFRLGPHMGEGAGALSAVLFVKGHESYPWAFHPRDLLSPQRLCFLEPSRWEVGFHTGVLGRHGRWVDNRMGAPASGVGGGLSGPRWQCHGSCPSVFLAVVPSGSGMLWRLMRHVAGAEWLSAVGIVCACAAGCPPCVRVATWVCALLCLIDVSCLRARVTVSEVLPDRGGACLTTSFIPWVFLDALRLRVPTEVPTFVPAGVLPYGQILCIPVAWHVPHGTPQIL